MERQILSRKFLNLLTAITLSLVISCNSTKESDHITSLTIQPTSLSLIEGEASALTATIIPKNINHHITWNSSDQNVAIVSEGIVTAISIGTATIKASIGDKTAECNVSVSAKQIPVSSITLNKTTLQLEKGASETLTATISPKNATDPTVRWSSSNPSIITVSQTGEIKAISGGHAQVMVSAEGESATCDVTVIVPLKSLTFTEKELIIDNTTEHSISITPVPKDATIKTLSWYIDDESIIKISPSSSDIYNKKVYAVGNGNTTIHVKAEDTNIQASLNIISKVKVSSISLGAYFYSYRSDSHSWHEITGGCYHTTYNAPLNLTVDYQPDIAYIDDSEITIDDDNYASFNENQDDIVAKSKEGSTIIEVAFPYSNIKQSFILYVHEYLYNAGVKNVQQGSNAMRMSFGGRLYSWPQNDIYIVDNVQFCDNDGRIIGSSMSPTEKISIFRNGTNNVSFSTPMINLTNLYNISIIDSSFDDFLSKCFFYVTYKKSNNDRLISKRLYLEPHNWHADYDY